MADATDLSGLHVRWRWDEISRVTWLRSISAARCLWHLAPLHSYACIHSLLWLTDRISLCLLVPVGSPSRGGDVAVYDINQPSLPTPFYSALAFISVFMALSTVFHFINSPDSSPPSSSVLLVLFLPYWSFQLYITLWKSPSARI